MLTPAPCFELLFKEWSVLPGPATQVFLGLGKPGYVSVYFCEIVWKIFKTEMSNPKPASEEYQHFLTKASSRNEAYSYKHTQESSSQKAYSIFTP